MKKLPSLTIFFPFYNDAGTVARQITAAYTVGQQLSDNLEVIALHGGNSRDATLAEIKKMQRIYPQLVIINKQDNREGYAVIKYGFLKASKQWIFYTDGDAQYHLKRDLPRLVARQLATGVDVVNGYKQRRQDNLMRVLAGDAYRALARYIFRLPIRDVDCDFRLIRRSAIRRIRLTSRDASILPELVKKLEITGATFTEIPVAHYERVYGKSNYSVFSLFKEKLIGDIKLYLAFSRTR